MTLASERPSPGTTIRRLFPRQLVGELLSKPWIDAVIPCLVMMVVVIVFVATIENYATAANASSLAYQFAEMALVAVAMGLVVMAGGIDLSVGAVLALTSFIAFYLLLIAQWPVPLVVGATLLAGALMGAVNGLLCGVLRLRAFLATLITMIIFRSVFNLLLDRYGGDLSMAYVDSAVWQFIGQKAFLGLHCNVVILALIAVLAHLALTRSRLGAHLMAVGGSRLAARRAGINVPRVQIGVYVLSGLLVAIASVLYAARVNSPSVAAGRHWEIVALTATVLGGVSLGGGRGSIMRILFGAITVMVLTNGLVRLGIQGGTTELATGGVLIAAVLFDVKWQKHRDKVLQASFVSPYFYDPPPLPEIAADSGSPWAMNDRLRDVEVIGLGRIDGPEDVILDRDGHLYTGVRQGEIIRFLAPDYSRHELFARTGGRPLGMAFDRDGNLITCIAGMGVYGIRPNREVYKITDQGKPTWFKVRDDSRILMADDLDIAPDGRIFFTEATTRYVLNDWIIDSLEAAGNGKLMCHDPRSGATYPVLHGLMFANGVCTAHDGNSILVNESWACSVKRYWIGGPKKGKVETVIAGLPGFPDNINRASNGHYWIAIAGVRSPIWDLAMREPGFRKRMVKQVPRDEWLYPNLNTGIIARIDEAGQVHEVLWDRAGLNHPTVTSMREHEGYLYIGGLSNNRIGRLKLQNADSGWSGPASYWG
jgi:ribose transport system permease protein